MSKFIDLTGQTFGRLTVIERAETKNGATRWVCKCKCGNEKVVDGGSLKSGHTKSCGCLNREMTVKANTKHGGTHERLFCVWGNMKKRCNNPNDKEYSRYGGRGIKICEEWNDYAVFREWAYSNGYDDKAERGKCTIDRINNDKGYSPDNCRWVDNKTQQNNKRGNHLVTFNGKTQTVAQWADELGIKKATLLQRINNSKWTIEKALSTP